MVRKNAERKTLTEPRGSAMTTKAGKNIKKSGASIGATTSGIGYSKTAKNRTTGAKTTSTGKLTPVTKEEYVGTGKMMKKAKKR
jgi:hypothetical protein